MDEIKDLNTEVETNEEENAIAGETRAEKFLRIAPSRVNKVLHALDTLGNLSGSGYEYTPEQVESIRSAINERFEEVMAGFEKKKNKSKDFSF